MYEKYLSRIKNEVDCRFKTHHIPKMKLFLRQEQLNKAVNCFRKELRLRVLFDGLFKICI